VNYYQLVYQLVYNFILPHDIFLTSLHINFLFNLDIYILIYIAISLIFSKQEFIVNHTILIDAF